MVHAFFSVMRSFRFGRRLRGLRAWGLGRVENHAVKLHRLLGLGIKGRDKYTQDKRRDCQGLHRSAPCLWRVHFAEHSGRAARKVLVKYDAESINTPYDEADLGRGLSGPLALDVLAHLVRNRLDHLELEQ